MHSQLLHGQQQDKIDLQQLATSAEAKLDIVPDFWRLACLIDWGT